MLWEIEEEERGMGKRTRNTRGREKGGKRERRRQESSKVGRTNRDTPTGTVPVGNTKMQEGKNPAGALEGHRSLPQANLSGSEKEGFGQTVPPILPPSSPRKHQTRCQ